MKKKITYLISVLALAFCFVFGLAEVSYAYTEEEKQQAKAWLSAHGYSPDAGGAGQAYQDYLAGKFDEELGYDTNGDGIPAATTEESSQQVGSTESETDNPFAKPDSLEAPDDNGSNGSATVKTDASNAGDRQTDSDDTDGSKAEDSLEGQDKKEKENQEQTTEDTSGESNQQDQNKEGITWYRTENQSRYQNAGIIVVVSGLFILLWGVFFRS